MNRDTLRRLASSLLFRLFVLLLIAYTLYHCLAAFSGHLVTDLVVLGNEQQLLTGTAAIFRDETVVTTTGGPYLISYTQEDGAKHHTQATVAHLYRTYGEQAAIAQRQAALMSLDDQIRALQNAHDLPQTTAQLSALRDQLRSQVLQASRVSVTGGSIGEIAQLGQSLTLLLNHDEALTTGGGSSVAAQAARLTLMRMNLLGGAAVSQSIDMSSISEQSGRFYYASHVDGFESLFSRAQLQNMSITEYDALMASATAPRTYGTAETVVGKLLTGFVWSITVPVSYEAAEQLSVGESYTVRFVAEQREITMTLDRVITSVGDGRAVLILSTVESPAGFSFTRFSDVEIVLCEVQGYRVPETALTELNGQLGVYILDGGRVSFRAIQIELRGDGYVLVHIPTAEEKEQDTAGLYEDGRYLSLRDIVITDGEDYYDGKYMD